MKTVKFIVPFWHEVKSFSTKVGIYGIGDFSLKLTSVLLIPIYISALTPEQYGAVTLIQICKNLISILAGLGVASAVIRYAVQGVQFSFETVIGTGFVFILLFGALGCILFLCIVPMLNFLFLKSNAYTLAFRVAAVGVPFQLVSNLTANIWQAKERPVMVSVFNLAITLIRFGMIILFLIVLKVGIEGIFFAELIACLSGTLVAMIFFGNKLKFFRLDVLKELLRFGVPMVPHKIAQTVNNVADRFLVQYFLGLSAVGVYSLAYSVSNLVIQACQPLQRAWGPYVYNRMGVEQKSRKIATVGNLYLTFIAFVGIIVVGFGPVFINFFDKAGRYNVSYYLLSTITVGIMMHAAYQIASIGIFAMRQTKYLPLITVSAGALNVVLNILFIPCLGIFGAALATLISYLVTVMFAYEIGNKLFPLNLNLGLSFVSVVTIAILTVNLFK